MASSSIAEMAQDSALQQRVTATAVKENVRPDPIVWADAHKWQISAQPGWTDAWEYAKNNNVENPGANSAVINDDMITAGVQALTVECRF